jgi:hypothetical protein
MYSSLVSKSSASPKELCVQLNHVETNLNEKAST